MRVSVKDGPENLGVILKKERCKQRMKDTKNQVAYRFVKKGFATCTSVSDGCGWLWLLKRRPYHGTRQCTVRK